MPTTESWAFQDTSKECANCPLLICRAPMEHLESITWKCRNCCQPATEVCSGNVHLCDTCHDRNLERVQQLQVGEFEERLVRQNGNLLKRRKMNPPLEPIPCLGKDCPFPKPLLSPSSTFDNGNNLAVGLSYTSSSSTSEFHTNGSSANCEQVYTCLICQSNSTEEQELAPDLLSSYQEIEAGPPPQARKVNIAIARAVASVNGREGARVEQHSVTLGSHNLLANPSGGLGLRGWEPLNESLAWQGDPLDWPGNPATTTNFVSSLDPCIMSQVVDLGRLAPDLLSSHQEVEAGPPFRTDDFAVEVSARYQERTDYVSFFNLQAIALDRNHRPLQRLFFDALKTPSEAPPNQWCKAELILEHLSLERTKYVAIVVSAGDLLTGKGLQSLYGNYGSKESDCSVRILWDHQNNTNNATRDGNV